MVEVRSEGSSLLGRPSSGRGRRSILALVCAAAVVGVVCVLAQQGRTGRSVLSSRQNFLMAKDLLDNGKDLQAAGRRDIQMARILLKPYDHSRSRGSRGSRGLRPYPGHQLAANATNGNATNGTAAIDTFATDAEEEWEEGPDVSPLEAAGVRVNGWAGSAEVQYLPGTIKYLSEQKMAEEAAPEGPNAPDAMDYDGEKETDWDYAKTKPLEKAGINIGKWFWDNDEDDDDDEDYDADVEDYDEQPQPAMNGTNATNATGPSPARAPPPDRTAFFTADQPDLYDKAENRLQDAGIHLDGMPWDHKPPTPTYYEPDAAPASGNATGNATAGGNETALAAEEPAAPAEPAAAEDPAALEEEAAAKARIATLYRQGRTAFKKYMASVNTRKALAAKGALARGRRVQ